MLFVFFCPYTWPKATPLQALGCFVLDRIPVKGTFRSNGSVVFVFEPSAVRGTLELFSSTWVVALKGQIATEMCAAVPQPQAISRTAIWPYLRPVYGFGKVPDGYPSDTRKGVFVLLLFYVLFPAKQEQNRVFPKIAEARPTCPERSRRKAEPELTNYEIGFELFLFPNHTLYLKAISGAGIVQVKPCPHLDAASGKCLAFPKPEVCRKAPAFPHEVKYVSPKCRFPTDDNTKKLWFENQLSAILNSK